MESIDDQNALKECLIGGLKGSLSLIPGGSLLIEAFFDTPTRIAQNRQMEFFNSTLENLKKIQETLIDLDYLQSEDFSDLLQHLRKKISLRKAKEKANFFARLCIANTLKTRPLISVDWQFQFIEILADLNDSEMNLLLALETHRSPSGASLTGVSNPFGFTTKSEFQLCFDSLISKGLAYDSSLSALPKLGVGANPMPRSCIDISPLGKRLIHFTKEIDAIVENASS